MTSAARKILEAALALDEPERAEIVNVLTESLTAPAIVLSERWTAEIGRRIAELEDGTVTPVEMREVEARIAARLRPR